MKKSVVALCLLGLIIVVPFASADEVAVDTKMVQGKTLIKEVQEQEVEVITAVPVEKKSMADNGSDQWSAFVEKYISGRLQLGTRMGYRMLTDEDSGHKGGTYGSGTFLGTIYALDEEQDYIPKYLYLRYAFSRYFAAELAYDSVTASTVATSIGYSTIKSDGDVTIYGPTLSLVASLPTRTKFTPYGSFGLGLYSGDFDEATHWALGYRDPTQYEALGSPSTSYGGRTRTMDVDSAVGLVVGAGCTYDFNDSWLVDLSMQYTSVDVDATFYGYTNGVLDTEQTGHFPLDNLFFRLGVAYTF